MSAAGSKLLIFGALLGAVQMRAAAIVPAKDKAQPVMVVPLTAPSSWVTQDDYPARALHDMVEGVTSTALTIDANGFVTDCVVTASSGSVLLDQTACSLLTARARFSLAKSAQGGHWTQGVRWQIPRPPAVDLRPVSFTIQYDVDENGKPANCFAQGGLPNGIQPDQACSELLKQATFKIAAGSDGKPVRRRVIQTFSVQITDLPGKDPAASTRPN